MDTLKLIKEIEAMKAKISEIEKQVKPECKVNDPMYLEEIKHHLIEEAKKRGFVPGLDCGRILNFNKNDGYVGKLSDAYTYFTGDDELDNVGITIYRKGNWATIKEEPVFELCGYPVKRIDADTITMMGIVGLREGYVQLLLELIDEFNITSIHIKEKYVLNRNHILSVLTFLKDN